MFPIAQRSYICNLGQIGQNVTKLSIKAVRKMMKLKGVARGKKNLCGFMSKCIRLSKAWLELEWGKIKQGELKKKKALF